MVLRAILAATLCVLALAARPAAAFEHVRAGDALGDDLLPRVGGGTAPLVGRAKANVVAFVRPGQFRSRHTLEILVRLERELRHRPVRFAVVVPGSDAAADVRTMVKKARLKMPVLVDEGDRLQGRLGVFSFPLVAIADEGGRLTGWEYHTTVNHADAVRARILRALGDIDDAALRRALDPPPSLDR
jgi:hypothetical protein